MQLTNAKKLILKTARDAFARQTGITLELLKKDPEHQILLLKTPEATAELEVMMVESVFAVYGMRMLWKRMQGLHQFVMVIPQIPAEKADELRKDGIQFIDTAGNGYINQPPLYLFIKGNKTQSVIKMPAVNRAFKQTGLRVLYALLCNPGLENETYRSIAAKTNVALGMVNWVVKDLTELGFLMETGKGRTRKIRLIQKERLLERWITAYAEQLRPKLVMGRYRGAEGWWQQAELKPEQALWGGEVAAAKLTDYLKPQTVTVYVDKDNPAAVLIPNRLKKDPEGDVELIGRFWQPDVIAPHGDTVHPILVYADLMATGNQRNIETARIIYDEHIVQLVGEN
jgi:hypothetical protein